MRYQKVCVEVTVRFLREGGMMPLSLRLEDGRTFFIDRVLSFGRAAARVEAILPVRYRCMIGGQEKFLYFEEEGLRWFVEMPVVS